LGQQFIGPFVRLTRALGIPGIFNLLGLLFWDIGTF